MADTKIKDADLRFGVQDAVVTPAYYAQTHYGDESTANDIENWRIPISTPGISSPGAISLAALQVLGQVCICVGEDILNPVLNQDDPILFIVVKNIIVYSKDDFGNVTTWAPAWYTLPEYIKARPIATTLLCYTVNGVMVTIDVNTNEVTKRNILPSMKIASDVEIGSNLLSALSLEFKGMTNHFDVGDTVRKDNGDGTTSFYRLNNVTTDSEGIKSAEWESLSDLKHKDDYTEFDYVFEKFINPVVQAGGDKITGTLTSDELDYLKGIIPDDLSSDGIISRIVPVDMRYFQALDNMYYLAGYTPGVMYFRAVNSRIFYYLHLIGKAMGDNVTKSEVYTFSCGMNDGSWVSSADYFNVGYDGSKGTFTLSAYRDYYTTLYNYKITLKTKGSGSNVLCDNGNYVTPQSIVFKPKEVTTLSRLPIDNHVIKVTVTQATSMSFALAPMDGMEYIIDILNNTNANIDQPLPNGDDWQVPKESITLVAGKVTEISVRYVFGKYVVKV